MLNTNKLFKNSVLVIFPLDSTKIIQLWGWKNPPTLLIILTQQSLKAQSEVTGITAVTDINFLC